MNYPLDVAATIPPVCGTCAQNNYRLCKRTCANGRTSYHWQCSTCGRTSAAVKKALAEQVPDLPAVDEAQNDRYWIERNAQKAKDWAETNALREITAAEWREGYNGFLDSPRWKQQRERVLDRDLGLCQCCLLYPATQVHHTEYPDGQWDVPLWTLRAVCDDCHERFSGTRWEGQ